MIKVTRINGEAFFINAEQIEYMETAPDTIVTVMSGRKFVVRETPEEVIDRVVSYRRRLFSDLPILKHIG